MQTHTFCIEVQQKQPFLISIATPVMTKLRRNYHTWSSASLLLVPFYPRSSNKVSASVWFCVWNTDNTVVELRKACHAFFKILYIYSVQG